MFERTGRSATLNAAGRRTLARAEALVASFDALGEADADAESVGTLKVGAIASVQATMVARALVPFREQFPLYRVHVTPGVSLHLMDQVDSGELDLAVLIQPPFKPSADLQWRLLRRESYVLLVPEGTEGDDWRGILDTYPFIQYDRGSFGGRQVERLLRSASIEPRQWLEIDDLQAMVAMVKNHLGVAVLPAAEAITPLLDKVRTIPLGPNLIFREVGVLFRKSIKSDAAARFIDHLA